MYPLAVGSPGRRRTDLRYLLLHNQSKSSMPHYEWRAPTRRDRIWSRPRALGVAVIGAGLHLPCGGTSAGVGPCCSSAQVRTDVAQPGLRTPAACAATGGPTRRPPGGGRPRSHLLVSALGRATVPRPCGPDTAGPLGARPRATARQRTGSLANCTSFRLASPIRRLP